MNKKIERIYNFVQQNEDLYYSKLTCGEKFTEDIMNTAKATSFQMVRYFIERILEETATNDSPTVNTVEVIHGRWERYIDEDEDVHYYTCSACNYMVIPRYKYCPNCGAKMDG